MLKLCSLLGTFLWIFSGSFALADLVVLNRAERQFYVLWAKDEATITRKICTVLPGSEGMLPRDCEAIASPEQFQLSTVYLGLARMFSISDKDPQDLAQITKQLEQSKFSLANDEVIDPLPLKNKIGHLESLQAKLVEIHKVRNALSGTSTLRLDENSEANERRTYAAFSNIARGIKPAKHGYFFLRIKSPFKYSTDTTAWLAPNRQIWGPVVAAETDFPSAREKCSREGENARLPTEADFTGLRDYLDTPSDPWFPDLQKSVWLFSTDPQLRQYTYNAGLSTVGTGFDLVHKAFFRCVSIQEHFPLAW